MPKAITQDAAAQGSGQVQKAGTAGTKDWRLAISDHVAYALLVYTGLHIFVTMTAVKAGKGAVLPYLALIVLVAAIIPACQWFEKRWEDFGEERAHDPSLAGTFRRDITVLWIGAIGLPLLVTGICKAVLAFF